MVTLHEVITFLVSMQISISSLQTHNVNRCGRSRHLARKLSLRRKRSSPNVFEMAATETITSPLLVMRSNLWASGYDVDGTDQTSLGQFSGRVQQTYKHSVPRFFVPEHGTMFTLALVRFPPTATKEIQYLNAKGALTYTDIAGDPVLYGNLPPREISMKDVFRSGDS